MSSGLAPLARRALSLFGPNVAARVVALVAVAAATVLVAHAGGPAAVGTYVLLRVLPGLVGVLCAAGLPGAVGFFLAGPQRGHPRLWATLVAVMAAGSALGAAVWLLLTPVLHHAFFGTLSPLLVAAVAVAVVTQLPVSVGKAALQGMGDRRGSDAAIAAEELAYLPAYAVLFGLGLRGPELLVAALVLADVVVGAGAFARIRLRGGLRGPWLPDLRLARSVVGYGTRGQIGGLILLLNLRLDFALLGWLAGPAVLGGYAVASKYAELLRLPGQAVTWVMYPRLSGASPGERVRQTARTLRPALTLTAAAALPLAVLAPVAVPLLYGAAFAAAVPLVWILLAGLLTDGAAGVLSAYLYGSGRPGLNSLALAAGLGVTAVLDVLLIPAHGAHGAAWASAVAYLTTTGVLFVLYRLTSERLREAALGQEAVAS